MSYNYLDAVRQDVINYIKGDVELAGYEDIEDLREFLYAELRTKPSVTGLAHGSYTLDPYQAEENLCHNWDLLNEVLSVFAIDGNTALERGAEYCDVVIRCYFLSQAIDEALEKLGDEWHQTHQVADVGGGI